ncbi:MAG TPA: hypothetical protein DEQ40_09055 [Oxalobacteraceae bacterium]|jgi:hypothetical protein|nr:hypothetical protein [Oxalobacteraceae bacterium]
MNFELHQAICAANNSVGQLMSADFARTHHMADTEEAAISYARKLLMDALDALSSYQAKNSAEAKSKVAA